MKSQGSIKIRADLLAEAVTSVVPRRTRKPYPLSLVYFAEDKALGVKEAYHALRGYRVPATGHWPDKVQVNGVLLAALVVKFPAEPEIELVALDEVPSQKRNTTVSNSVWPKRPGLEAARCGPRIRRARSKVCSPSHGSQCWPMC